MNRIISKNEKNCFIKIHNDLVIQVDIEDSKRIISQEWIRTNDSLVYQHCKSGISLSLFILNITDEFKNHRVFHKNKNTLDFRKSNLEIRFHI